MKNFILKFKSLYPDKEDLLFPENEEQLSIFIKNIYDNCFIPLSIMGSDLIKETKEGIDYISNDKYNLVIEWLHFKNLKI